MDLVEQPQQAPAVFDLATLEPAVAKSTKARTDRIIAAYRKTVEGFAEIGRELIAAQGELKHGEFAAWMETLPLGRATAYRTMEMSRNLGAEILTVRNLPLTVVQKLAAAPEPVRTSVVERMKGGEEIPPSAILSEVQTAKDQDCERRADEKEAARRARLTQEQRDLEDARRKRDAKNKALREKQAEKEREEHRQQDERERVKRDEACAMLLEMIGADRLAAFVERFGNGRWDIIRRAGEVAQMARAEQVQMAEVDASEINDRGVGYMYPSEEERTKQQALMVDIKANGLREPLIVCRVENEARLKILDGRARYVALLRLDMRTIPVRIAPPLDVDTILGVPERNASVTADTKPAAGKRQTAARGGHEASRSDPSESLPIMDWIKDGKG